jgi:hypothetical protein
MEPDQSTDVPEKPPVTVLLVASAGGQLFRLLRLRPWWELYDRAWVTPRSMDTDAMLSGEQVTWVAAGPPRGRVSELVANTKLAWRTIRSERPLIVVSTGASLALPFFAIARLHGARTVYVESSRIDGPSRSGRLCYPLSDLFILQWEEQRRYYKKGELVGALL